MALSPSDVEDLVSRFVKDPSYIGNFTSLEEGEEPLLHYRLSQYNHVHFSAVDAEDNGAYHIFTLAGSIRFIDSKLSGNFDESAPFP